MGSIPTPATLVSDMEIKMPQETIDSLKIQRFSEISQQDKEKILDEVVRVEKETWPEEIQAPREKFEARAAVFPQGFLLISLPGQGLVGVSTAEIINFNPEQPLTSWEDITDNGWVKKTHNPDGNALYLVSVGASPKTAGKGIGTRLVQEQINLTKDLGLEWLVLGSRVPGYAEYHISYPEVSVERYLRLTREDGQALDPEIRFYERCGLEINKAVPNYMENDPESENYGVVMIWRNKLSGD